MADIWNKYANTAARKHGTPGREMRPKSTTIDAHCHVTVPRVAEIVTPHLKQSTDPLVAHSTPETQGADAKQAGRSPHAHEHDRRALRCDGRHGRRHAARVPPPPQIYYTLPLEVGVKAARALNDGIAEYVGRHRTGCVALGGVPMQDGNEAAKELERCMKQLGFKGVEILTNVEWQGAVRSGLRAVLEEGRGARRAGDDPPERLHAAAALRRDSTSTT